METDKPYISGADPADSETPSISAEVELESNDVELVVNEVELQENEENPWPYLRDYFGFMCRNGNSFIMQCKLCLPRQTELAAYKNSTSNLRKHVERKHPLMLKAYSDFVATRKRTLEPLGAPSKQAKITHVMAVGANRRVPQAKVNKLMINFICEGLHPFSVVEQPAFKELLLTLNPQCKVMSIPAVRARIEAAAIEMKKTLMSHLSKVSYVATTTDSWTAHQQSYIVVTAHWIDEDTLKRKSAALACQRLKGSYTFDVLAGALDDIHCQYGIRGKVVRITTDSGSNFIKAFSVFGEQSQPEDAESESDQDSPEEPKSDYLDTFSILEQDSGLEYHLPLHQRCACHLLNLVATTDAAMAEKKNDTYKRLSHAAFGKCQAIWNKTGRSYMEAEIVDDKCKLQLIRPNQTRWNSTYMAVERITHIIQEKGEEAIRNVCEEFKVKMLSPAVIAFLNEYCTVMKPVVKAFDILQSETNTHMGWLLPVIFQLQAKLSRLETSSKMCLPLIRAIQDGVQKRFGGMMEDPELIAAAILLPKYKNTWTERADILETGLVYVRQHLEQMVEAEVEQVRQHSSDEEVFFSLIKSIRAQGTEELDGYLACVSNKMDLLNSFPHIKKLSLRLNTGLPASAACERLFSCDGLLFTAKKARMNSTDFENQLLLKLNRKFRE
ncbi:zinc finger BED domain-containing protein 4-like [Salminus brasiliensis]|uniref:zinc finger BED domain-containing protein 4-like n=1 Tax=Salminus brasiliensis TaxID=930266 RepID=UPI003B82FDD6